MNIFFIKLDRIAAWVLMAVIIIYAVSGYGMTKGLIDRDIARSLHLVWLGGLGAIAFIIHTYRAIYCSFLRWKIWNKATKGLLISFYVLFACFFFYVHFFYTPSYDAVPAVSIAVETKTTVFTATTLAAYDGRNGQPAYAAVDGIVYDFSSVFRNGNHHGYQAGVDLTADFYAQHPAALLSRYPIAGTYQK
jgi:predicted heme/steroid binding protein